MKLHNPFKSESSDVTLAAYISAVITFTFCFGWLISKVGPLAVISILAAIIVLVLLLAPFYVTIKYIFTGKE